MRTSELPNLYLITPEPNSEISTPQFLRNLEMSLRSGIRLVQLRAKTLAPHLYKELALKVSACCKKYDAILLLNADPALAMEIDAGGIHLNGTRLATYDARPMSSDKLISAACHSLEQIKKAEIIGVDFVTLSPVLHTATHPDAQPLGWENFSAIAKQTPLPIYALGGMSPELLNHAQIHGAYGVAGIRSFWGKLSSQA